MDEPKAELFVSIILCREVLFSREGLPTAFGIINNIGAIPALGPVPGTIKATDEGEEQSAEFKFFQPIKVCALITLYSDESQDVAVSVKLRNPHGEFANPAQKDTKMLTVQSEDNGRVFDMTAEVSPSIEGLYWFEFYADGELKAKAPLRIKHVTQQPQPFEGFDRTEAVGHAAHQQKLSIQFSNLAKNETPTEACSKGRTVFANSCFRPLSSRSAK